MTIPTPSAWRYTHEESGRFIAYQYDTARPKNCNHPNYVGMFTAGQLNQYGQACFDEGVSSVHTLEPMTVVADRYAHRMALELECVLADRPGYYDKAMQVLGEYRSAMNAIHEQHSPTRMGEPLRHNFDISGEFARYLGNSRNNMGRATVKKCLLS